jgi:hypothetical protein
MLMRPAGASLRRCWGVCKARVGASMILQSGKYSAADMADLGRGCIVVLFQRSAGFVPASTRALCRSPPCPSSSSVRVQCACAYGKRGGDVCGMRALPIHRVALPHRRACAAAVSVRSGSHCRPHPPLCLWNSRLVHSTYPVAFAPGGRGIGMRRSMTQDGRTLNAPRMSHDALFYGTLPLFRIASHRIGV